MQNRAKELKDFIEKYHANLMTVETKIRERNKEHSAILDSCREQERCFMTSPKTPYKTFEEEKGMKHKRELKFTRVYNRLMRMSMGDLRNVVRCMPTGWDMAALPDCYEIRYNGQVKRLDDVARSIIRNHNEWILN